VFATSATRGCAVARFSNDDNENHNKHCNCRRLPFVHRPSLGAGAWADVAGGAVTMTMETMLFFSGAAWGGALSAALIMAAYGLTRKR
jgi:hypothetical protein